MRKSSTIEAVDSFYAFGSTFSSIAEDLGTLAVSFWAYNLFGPEKAEWALAKMKETVSATRNTLEEMEAELHERSMGLSSEVAVTANGFLLLRRAIAEFGNALDKGEGIRADFLSVFDAVTKCFPTKDAKDFNSVSTSFFMNRIAGVYDLIADDGFVERFVKEQKILNATATGKNEPPRALLKNFRRNRQKTPSGVTLTKKPALHGSYTSTRIRPDKRLSIENKVE